jgi:hypothetical protein
MHDIILMRKYYRILMNPYICMHSECDGTAFLASITQCAVRIMIMIRRILIVGLMLLNYWLVYD